MGLCRRSTVSPGTQDQWVLTRLWFMSVLFKLEHVFESLEGAGLWPSV